MAREPADIRALHEPAVSEFAPDAEVQIDGVRRLQLVVQRDGDGEGVRIRYREDGEGAAWKNSGALADEGIWVKLTKRGSCAEV